MSKDTKPLTLYEQREHREITQIAYTRALADLSKALVSIVKQVAWLPRSDSPESLCPWCGVYKSGGHAENCLRQAALKLAEELMPFDWDEHYKTYLKAAEEENEASKRSGMLRRYYPEQHLTPGNRYIGDDKLPHVFELLPPTEEEEDDA